MKITELKIKENITPDLISEAIEYISNSCFIGGNYNPYYKGFAEKVAIAQLFLDGIEYEDGDSLFVICELEDVKKLINKFYSDERFSEQTRIMNIIRENVNEVVDYKKQRMIHGADAIESISRRLNEFGDFITDLDIALGNLLKINFDDINNEDVENARVIISKLKDAGTVLDRETIARIIRDAANFDLDKASQDIIDDKNKQIEELLKKNKELEDNYNTKDLNDNKKEVDA